jgi:hypothetical protein
MKLFTFLDSAKDKKVPPLIVMPKINRLDGNVSPHAILDALCASEQRVCLIMQGEELAWIKRCDDTRNRVHYMVVAKFLKQVEAHKGLRFAYRNFPAESFATVLRGAVRKSPICVLRDALESDSASRWYRDRANALSRISWRA